MDETSIIPRPFHGDVHRLGPPMTTDDGELSTRTSRPTEATAERQDNASNEAVRHPPGRESNRYEVIAEHGRGGLGRVLRAYDREMDREVAIKELIEHTYRSEARFVREALITARLEHPAIVPVHETGRWNDGTPYYAMKLIAGRPLSELIAASDARAERLALLPHVAAVTDAVAYAHSVGIVHRDLKPSNVVIGEFGETIVVDWGVAKDLRGGRDVDAEDAIYRRQVQDNALTRAGSVIGTPVYMAPEQARGDKVDERVDVHAIGVMLYELCMGSPSRPIDVARALRAGNVDSDLAAVILRCLAPERTDRYADGRALAADLKRLLAGRRVKARTYSPLEVAAHWLRRHRAVGYGIGGAVAVLAVIASTAAYSVVQERDRARAALRDADRARKIADQERDAAARSRDQAIDSEAALLVKTDPSRAERLLANEPQTPQRALLRSRASATGVAKHVIEPNGFRIDRTVTNASLTRAAVALGDRSLYLLDLETGTTRKIDEGLTEPPLLRGSENGWIYVRSRGDERQLMRAALDGDVSRVGLMAELPLDIASAGSAIYWTDHQNLLRRVGAEEILFRDVLLMKRFGDGLLTCVLPGRLFLLTSDSTPKLIGDCAKNSKAWDLVTASHAFLVRTAASTYALHSQDGTTRVVVPGKPTHQVSLADSGLIGVVDRPGNTWFLRSEAGSAEAGPSVPSEGYVVATDESLVAFGYADGTGRARDIVTGDRWQMMSHPDEVVLVAVRAEERRAVTVGGGQVRVWDLPHHGAQRLAEIGVRAFNAIRISPSMIAVDGMDGVVRAIPMTGGHAAEIHRHSSIAFGLATPSSEICSGGHDGRVLCTDTREGRTHSIQAPGPAVRAILASHDSLWYSLADGTVWRSVNLAVPARLMQHRGEAYRLAAAPDGTFASGDRTGELIVLSASGEVVARGDARSGVLGLVWQGNELWSGHEDGCVRRWTRTLEIVETECGKGPVRFLFRTTTGIAIVRGRDRLFLREATGTTELDLDGPIQSVSISNDGSTLGIATRGEAVFVSVGEKEIRSVRIGSGDLSCVRFLDAESAIVCDSDEGVSRVELGRVTSFQWD